MKRKEEEEVRRHRWRCPTWTRKQIALAQRERREKSEKSRRSSSERSRDTLSRRYDHQISSSSSNSHDHRR